MSDRKAWVPKRQPKNELVFPCLDTKLVPSEKVIGNDWNPNFVAPAEMELLALSMEADGVTQPVVTAYDPKLGLWLVADGFHRHCLIKYFFKSPVMPVVEIAGGTVELMRSTVRHNRARGKHAVDWMANLVVHMIKLGSSDLEIAEHLGMEAEEVLRLKQQTGFAELYKKHPYSRSWEEVPNADSQHADAA